MAHTRLEAAVSDEEEEHLVSEPRNVFSTNIQKAVKAVIVIAVVCAAVVGEASLMKTTHDSGHSAHDLKAVQSKAAVINKCDVVEDPGTHKCSSDDDCTGQRGCLAGGVHGKQCMGATGCVPTEKQCKVVEGKSCKESNGKRFDDKCQGNRGCLESGFCSGNSGCAPTEAQCSLTEKSGHKCNYHSASKNDECTGNRYCQASGRCDGDSGCKASAESCKIVEKGHCSSDLECSGDRGCNNAGFCDGKSGCSPPHCGLKEQGGKCKEFGCQGWRTCSRSGWCHGDNDCSQEEVDATPCEGPVCPDEIAARKAAADAAASAKDAELMKGPVYKIGQLDGCPSDCSPVGSELQTRRQRDDAKADCKQASEYLKEGYKELTGSYNCKQAPNGCSYSNAVRFDDGRWGDDKPASECGGCGGWNCPVCVESAPPICKCPSKSS